MTTRAKVMRKGHTRNEILGNDREGSGGVGTLNGITQQQPSRTMTTHPIFCKDSIVINRQIVILELINVEMKR